MGRVSSIAGTSTQRTYRYLRVSLIGAVLALAVSAAAVIVDVGPISSVSALYYTSAGPVFSGVLIAVSLALIALSGRSLAQSLLDLAAVFAPLIVIVPTRVDAGPDVCSAREWCVPERVWPAIDNGMVVFAVVGACAVVAALVIAASQRSLTRGTIATVAAAAVVVAAMTGWWMLGPESFRTTAHLVATVCFFALVAAVSAVTALTSHGAYRRLYGVVALALVADLVLLVVIVATGAESGSPAVFVAEAVAIALFAAFWIIQTVQTWPDVDPAIATPQVP